MDGDAKLIRRVGAELYGDFWIAPLSPRSRSIRGRCAVGRQGKDNRPAAILQMLQGLLRERIAKLEQLAAGLESDSA